MKVSVTHTKSDEPYDDFNRFAMEERKFDTIGHESNPDLSYALKSSNWFEVRFAGKCPERRAYHISFVIDKK